MNDTNHIEHVEQIRARTEESLPRVKKLERGRRFIDVVFLSIFAVLLFKATSLKDNNYLFLASMLLFGTWGFSKLHLNHLIASELLNANTGLIYLYVQELRSYAVASIETLFNAVEQLANMPDKDSLPLPPPVEVPTESMGGKPLGTRERDTLLTIIAALAKEAKLQIDQPGKTALYIEGLTDQLGAHVSKRAIEDHLKKIPNALENRMK